MENTRNFKITKYLKKKKVAYFCIITVIFLISLLIFGMYKRIYQPISENEFTIVNPGFNGSCIKPVSKLKRRCRIIGGELRSELTFLGMGEIFTFGCYPKGKTVDAGKLCSDNRECDGECIWLDGDIITSKDGDIKTSKYESMKCSSYKKPLFIYPQELYYSQGSVCDSD
jgi:hypothetical protein